MKLLIALAVVAAVWVVFKRLDNRYHVGFLWRWLIMQIKKIKSNIIFYGEIEQMDSMRTAVCADLGAFRNPLQKIPDGIATIVLMEDRSPEFFLGFEGYEPSSAVPLKEHGPFQDYNTQEDLRILVQRLHEQGKKVLIGFWGFWGDEHSGPTEWLKRHPELKPRQKDESDIGSPFAILEPEKVSFAEYIAGQYLKLQSAFGFDGLFLGDGLSGFRSFWHLERYNDRASSASQWSDFYRVVSEAVHKAEGELWAYDCMGLDYEDAAKHGADYRLLAASGLDVLVFQSYPIAWARYFKVPGKKGLAQDSANIRTLNRGMQGMNVRIYFTLEVGDPVEGWAVTKNNISRQVNAFQENADGKLIVWANDLLAEL